MHPIVTALVNEDYVIEIATGAIVHHSEKLLSSFGPEIKKILQSNDTWQKSAVPIQNPVTLQEKLRLLDQSSDSKMEYFFRIEEELFEVQDVFWKSKDGQYLKGFLFVKDGRTRIEFSGQSLADIIENVPYPYAVFNRELTTVHLTNRLMIDLLQIPLSAFSEGLPLHLFFKDQEVFQAVIDWIFNSPENVTNADVSLFLGEDGPRWYELQLVKIKVDNVPCVSVFLRDIDLLKRTEYELLRKNSALEQVIQVQNAFLLPHKDEKSLDTLMTRMADLSYSSLGFIAKVKREQLNSHYSLRFDAFVQLDAVTPSPADVKAQEKELEEIIQQCVLEKKPTYAFYASKSNREIKSCLVMPVCCDGTLIACVGLANKADMYTKYDEGFLEPIAAVLGNIYKTKEIQREKEFFAENAKEKELIFQRFTESSSDIVFILNEDLQSGFVSNSILKVLGFSAEDKKTLKTMAGLCKEALKEKYRTAENTFRLVRKIKTFDKSFRWLDTSINIIKDKEGRVFKYFGLCRDISLQMESEDVLRSTLKKEKELSELKSQFISLVSHEFKTPLSIMKSSTEIGNLYLENPDTCRPEKMRKQLDKISNEIANLNNLLERLLNSEKLNQGQFPVNKEMIQVGQFIKHFQQQHCIVDYVSLHMQPDVQGVYCHWDITLIEQVLVNLIDNALKYSEKDARPLVEFELDGEVLLVRVTDKGIGIPEEELRNIFEPFTARNV
ncbi:PAS/PAC sensor signal transduction histidine kinase [Nitritalea halalkaliphila LW7]|uniref:histidine kinase n=1 Tax=Nitritalea halalkaliphila LW7 TaxID=1189621 RepID=I5CAM0_9BACT|nr:ATP-binding protein [Nitritalea halalkaliphila]EIM78872.1 PAS/PAC sensor signal transduction histidine kinase [Nitritalea halalkaliphila LW7]